MRDAHGIALTLAHAIVLQRPNACHDVTGVQRCREFKLKRMLLTESTTATSTVVASASGSVLPCCGRLKVASVTPR